MLTDPIADMLTRIRNANMVSNPEVELPSSNVKQAIAAVLKREAFIKSYRVETREGKKVLQIYLRYSDDAQKVITHLERVSKPGCRKYVNRDEIPRVLNGLGICILSTSRGIITGEEARRLGVGGEVLCYIW